MLERSIVIFFMLLFSLPILQTAVNNIAQQSMTAVSQEETKIEDKVKAIVNYNHLTCLATGIYYEAGGEAFIGQVAVARVIMNRVLHGFGSNPCNVVYQTTTLVNNDGDATKLCQFSWVCEGKTTPSENNPRYQRAKDIAKQVLAEDKWNDLLPDNTLFFHNLTVAPRWVYKRVTTIGNHVFYSKGPEKKSPSTVSQDK